MTRDEVIAELREIGRPQDVEQMLRYRELRAMLLRGFNRTPREVAPISPPPATIGLGDLLGEFFSAMGVTEDRYRAAKEAVGLDPNCNCAERKEKLNALGERLGINLVAAKFSEWIKGKPRKAREK